MSIMAKRYGELVNFDFHAPFASKNGQIYSVQSGDTLSNIARIEFGDSRYWPFIWLNNINICNDFDAIILTPSLLTPGKVIKLPDKRLVIEWVRRHRLPEYHFGNFSSESLFAFYLYMHNRDAEKFPDPFQCADGPKYSQVSDNFVPGSETSNNKQQGQKLKASYTISFEGLKTSYPSITIKNYAKIDVNFEFKFGKVIVNKTEEDPLFNINQENLKPLDFTMKQKCDLVENCISSLTLGYDLGGKGINGKLTINNVDIVDKLNLGELNLAFDSKSLEVTKKAKGELWDFKGELEAGVSTTGLILKGSIAVKEKYFEIPYTKAGGKKGLISICYKDLQVIAKITIYPVYTNFSQILYDAVKNIEKNVCNESAEYKDAYKMLECCAEILRTINLERLKKIYKPYDHTYNPTTKSYRDIQKQLAGNNCSIDGNKKKYSTVPAKKKSKTSQKNNYMPLPDGIKEVSFSPATPSNEKLNFTILYDEENYKCTNELLRRKNFLYSLKPMDLDKLKFFHDEIFDDNLRKSIIGSNGLPFSYLYIDMNPVHMGSQSDEIIPVKMKDKNVLVLGSVVGVLTKIGKAIISAADKAATAGMGFIIINQEFFLEISRSNELNQENYKNYNL